MVQRVNFEVLSLLGSVANPALAQDAATKNYVDTRASGSINVNSVLVPSPANLKNNPLSLGVDWNVPSATSDILGTVRDADVSSISDREIGLLIGAASSRQQMSNGSDNTPVIIGQVAGQPVLMSVDTATNASDIVSNLNALGVNALTISNNAQSPITNTILVESYFALAFQVQITFPITTTRAQVEALFINQRSDSIFFGGPLTGTFIFRDPPRAEIIRLAGTVTPTPGGANTQIQFNNNGVFGGSSNLTWNGTQLGVNIVSAAASNVLSLRSDTGVRIADNNANFVGINGTAAGSSPSIASQGSDTNINLIMYGRGTGGIQIGTLGNATPLIVADAAVQTALTPGTAGQVLTSAGAAKTPYWGTGGSGGSTTLQGLTDVAITEPVFAQVGTATVVSISAGTTSIVVTSAAGISVGDWLRGGTVMPGQVPALQVISIVGTLIEFNTDPTAFFVVGNFIYRLPENLEGARLSFSNAQNKWISSASLNFLPMDTISWVSLAGDPYLSAPGSPIVVAPITTNSANLASPWTFGIGTLGTFPSPSEVCGTDALGRQVTGQYVSAAQSGTPTAILEAIKFDRVSGGSFVINNTYPLTWRAGTFALPDYVRFNTGTNAITQGQAAVDLRTATLIGSVPNTFTNQNALSVSVGFTGNGTIWQSVSTVAGYNAAVAAMLTTGATQPVGAGNWTLPSYSIFISNLASPSATQIGTITTITQNAAANLLSITFGGGNQAYFSTQTGSAQTLFTQTNKFTFQPPPQTEIIRLAGTQGVTSLNTLTGAILAVPGTGIGIVTNPVNNQIQITNTGSGSGISASNSTTYNSVQSETNPMFVVNTFLGNISNAVLVGMPLAMATGLDQNSTGGLINGVAYVSSSNVMATQRGISFPVSVTPLPEFRVSVTFGVFRVDITFTATDGGDATAGDIRFAGAWFSKATLGSGTANDPRINNNIFPLFNNGTGGTNEGTQLSAYVPPVILGRVAQGTPTTVTATYRYTISPSEWRATGNGANYTGSSQEYHPYFEIDEMGTGAYITNAAFVDQVFSNYPTAGGIEVLIAISGTGGSTPSLQQTVNIGNTVTNASPNIGSILLIDSATAKATTLDGTRVKAQSLVLDGSSSGSITFKASPDNVSYPVVLPAGQGAIGEFLVNDGLGNLSWEAGLGPQIIRLISTANINPSGAQTVDGVAVATGDLVLLQNETIPNDNSLYRVSTTGPWGQIISFTLAAVFAREGTANSGKTYTLISEAPPQTWILTAINSATSTVALAWDIFSVASRYNSAFVPVPNVSATFETPAVTATGTVHNYFRYAGGVQSSFFRFVPVTDSALTNPSLDSFWASFSGTVLSGLLTQRGNF